ncbi:MAG: hypothetical protein KBS47_03540 [Bacteroidales bacterium]|nr:hypothetical protein [Candidatus Equimonas enterica]
MATRFWGIADIGLPLSALRFALVSCTVCPCRENYLPSVCGFSPSVKVLQRAKNGRYDGALLILLGNLRPPLRLVCPRAWSRSLQPHPARGALLPILTGRKARSFLPYREM